jgi:hypothetical protein
VKPNETNEVILVSGMTMFLTLYLATTLARVSTLTKLSPSVPPFKEVSLLEMSRIFCFLTLASLSLILYFLISAIGDFKEQMEAAEEEKVTKLVTELREIDLKDRWVMHLYLLIPSGKRSPRPVNFTVKLDKPDIQVQVNNKVKSGVNKYELRDEERRRSH